MTGVAMRGEDVPQATASCLLLISALRISPFAQPQDFIVASVTDKEPAKSKGNDRNPENLLSGKKHNGYFISQKELQIKSFGILMQCQDSAPQIIPGSRMGSRIPLSQGGLSLGQKELLTNGLHPFLEQNIELFKAGQQESSIDCATNALGQKCRYEEYVETAIANWNLHLLRKPCNRGFQEERETLYSNEMSPIHTVGDQKYGCK